MERTPPPALPDAAMRAVTAGDAARAERPIPVAVGQVLQATVVAQAEDRVWLGHRGGVFAARAAFPLEPGRTYEFVVAATSPQIELAPARAAAPSPARPTAAPGGADLLALLQTWAADLADDGAPAAAPRRERGHVAPPLQAALASWGAGRPTADALAAFDRHLGHEHEARLLRLLALPPETQGREAADLGRSAKAEALRALDAAAQGGRPAPAPASALVLGLSQIERDNAARSERAAPLWLPLPACPDAGLRDARMFLVADRDAGEDRAAPAEAPFTIVLLLDLTRLGELRVDIALRGDAIDVAFLLLSSDATATLRAGLDGLRAQLQDAGLSVRRLEVRECARPSLPVTDLALPPCDGSALVDLHA